LISLADFNTLHLPAFARSLVALERSADLLSLSESLGSRPRLILGGGSNLVLQSSEDQPFEEVIVHNRLRGIVRLPEKEGFVRIRCAGGESWHAFVMWTLAQGLGGLENLALIPGTVGAAPIQNIGAYGVELAERIEAVHAWDFSTKDHLVFPRESCRFDYRHSVFKEPSMQGPWNAPRFLVTGVDFCLWPAARAPQVLAYAGISERLDQMGIEGRPQPLQIAHAVISLRREKLPDPEELGNAGSFFKNPIVPEGLATALQSQYPQMPVYSHAAGKKLSAGWLIESAGLKGARRGAAGVYSRHALILVNHGRATGQDILGLARDIQQAVMGRFGVWLEPEPQILPPLHAA
jgi:UDP-N-acetylmuramate dehydrogenase